MEGLQRRLLRFLFSDCVVAGGDGSRDVKTNGCPKGLTPEAGPKLEGWDQNIFFRSFIFFLLALRFHDKFWIFIFKKNVFYQISSKSDFIEHLLVIFENIKLQLIYHEFWTNFTTQNQT